MQIQTPPHYYNHYYLSWPQTLYNIKGKHTDNSKPAYVHFKSLLHKTVAVKFHPENVLEKTMSSWDFSLTKRLLLTVAVLGIIYWIKLIVYGEVWFNRASVAHNHFIDSVPRPPAQKCHEKCPISIIRMWVTFIMGPVIRWNLIVCRSRTV